MLAWRDSIPHVADVALQGQVRAAESARTPMERLRLGWLLLAEGDRTDSAPPMARAADQFYEVTVRQPRWILGWYGLGEAKRHLGAIGAREIRSAHQPPGTGWRWGAVSAYMRALELDSTYVPAAEGIAGQLPYLTSEGRFVLAWRAMRRALATDSNNVATWLATARGQSDEGAYDSALTTYAHVLTIPDAPRGAVMLLRARALYALERPEIAESSYYAGATVTDSLGLSLYRQDVQYVASPEELRAWDTLPVGARERWLRDFWGERERASGRPAGSRLIEHNIRIRYARAHFSPIPTWMRQYSFTMENRDTLPDIDDRGVVYVRHGEPDMTAGMIVNATDNASWLYFRPEGNLLFHFVMGPRYSGWHLTTSIADITGPPGWPAAYSSRMGLDPVYGMLGIRLQQDSILLGLDQAARRVGGAPQYQSRRLDFEVAIDRERVARRADIKRGLSTDSDPLRFDREFEPIVQAFGAATADPETGQLLVAMSVPASDRLPGTPLPDGGVGYVLRLRVTAADDSGRTTLDVDSLIRLRSSAPLTEGQHLSFVRSFRLPATGDQRVRMILTDSARTVGAVRIVNGVPVPSMLRRQLVITDLVVGKTGSGAVWHRPDGTQIALNPLNAWRSTESMEIGFELSGLTTGMPYQVKLAVSDLGADSTRPPRAAVEFENQASGTRELITQSLALRALRPGRYLLTVTVTAGDRSIKRDRRITISAPR